MLVLPNECLSDSACSKECEFETPLLSLCVSECLSDSVYSKECEFETPLLSLCVSDLVI